MLESHMARNQEVQGVLHGHKSPRTSESLLFQTHHRAVCTSWTPKVSVTMSTMCRFWAWAFNCQSKSLWNSHCLFLWHIKWQYPNGSCSIRLGAWITKTSSCLLPVTVNMSHECRIKLLFLSHRDYRRHILPATNISCAVAPLQKWSPNFLWELENGRRRTSPMGRTGSAVRKEGPWHSDLYHSDNSYNHSVCGCENNGLGQIPPINAHWAI